MKIRIPVCFISAILSAITYGIFATLAYTKYPLPLSPFRNWLSDLGNQIVNPQGASFYNIGMILCALFLAIWFTSGLSQWRMKDNTIQQRLLFISQFTGILTAFGLIMSALYPINFEQVHSFWSKIHFMMFGMGFGFSVAALRYHPRIPKASLYLGAVAAVLPTLMLIFYKAYWLEWIAVGLFIIYILWIGIASLIFTLHWNSSVSDKSLIHMQGDSSAEVTGTCAN